MAYQSKADQRRALSQNYASGESMLTSGSIKGVSNMGNDGKKLVGKMMSGPGAPKLYGKTGKADGYSSIAGRMSGTGFNKSGGSAKVANVPSSKGGNKGTIRMNFDGGDDKASGWTQKPTGTTPKALRGGKAG